MLNSNIDTNKEDILVKYDMYLWSTYGRKYDYQAPKRDELLKIFNITQEEADYMKKRYIRSLMRKKKEKRKRCFSLYYESSRQSDKLFILEHIKDIDKDINKYENNLNYIGKKNMMGSIDLIDLKTIPIPKLLEQWGIEMKNNFFRIRVSDKTPSCKYYPDTNSFYDFGAGFGGSVVDLVIAKEECNLPSAIKDLTNLYHVL